MALPRVVFCSLFLFSSLLSSSYSTKVTDYLEQSYFFNYDPSAVPVPVTTQCDTIHITWDRSTATGPNPTAPYYLQIYTSAYVFPFVVSAGSGLSFDFQVPFGPGTLYQICMFDKNGNTGGCQAVFAVVANQTSDELSCSNSTLSFPLGPLDVDAQVSNGPLSQYGWVDQCTDIMVTPKNGTPPYTFTAAPALHPPYNITSNDGSSINWTVTLTWASPFFISVADSAGNFWSNGPLHSGGGGPTTCFSEESDDGLGTGAIVGIGVGGVAFGALAGILAAFCFYRHRPLKSRTDTFMNIGSSPLNFNNPLSLSSSHYTAVPSNAPPSGHVLDGSVNSQNSGHALLGQGNPYHVEPFVLPREQSHHSTSTPRSPSSLFDPNVFPGPSSGPLSSGHDSAPMARTSSSMQNQVYVVHHDGGRAPITVYHQDGTEVVELPPRYADDANLSSSQERGSGSELDLRSEGRSTSALSPIESSGPSFLQQQRRPDRVPHKRARESLQQLRT